MTDRRRDEPLDMYRRARDAMLGALVELQAVLERTAGWHDARSDLEQLAQTIARLRDGQFILAVVGEFSSGKSFLLNALLGKVEREERLGTKRIVGLLATDINPSTATITELVYGNAETAVAYYPNGRQERIPLGRLSRFVAVGQDAKLHDATGSERDAPSLVRVHVESAFLQNGFIVADTPGLASINPAHRRATLRYLPGADAVLYLVDTQQPFSTGDASFLGIVRRYIETIFIVQTKIDLWRMRDGERETWQSAAARIVAQAAIHAPDVPVYPLSARDYAEGLIDGDSALIAQSRFAPFRAALDASLVATTGRSRLRRVAAQARRLVTRAADALARERVALATDEATLRGSRDTLVPALAAIDESARAAQTALEESGSTLNGSVAGQGSEMLAQLRRTLARAFDTADIARLRDRAKLHGIVDDTLAAAVGRFAGDVADMIAVGLRAQAKTALTTIIETARAADGAGRLQLILDAIAGERLALTEDAAAAFGADPSSGAWSTDLQTGIRSTIVLGALGGPAVGLVDAIAQRFAAAPFGTYMKRELLADLRTTLLADFDAEMEAFSAANAERVQLVAHRLAERAGTVAGRIRSEALESIDNALAARQSGADMAALDARSRASDEELAQLATRIETISETFGSESRAARNEHAALPAEPRAGAIAVVTAGDARFDAQTYEHGLRPERWRVAIVGALRRGKSSLINTIADARVLPDEGSDVEMRFPVHVRYGPLPKAYALGDDAAWDPIDFDIALEAATRTPVLIETPWALPRELVLVHTPAFDSGLPDAETIAFAAVKGASELLALFSRQLSDLELDVYGRMANVGKPIAFVHTIADNEASAERRNVVSLADRYLRERAIVPQRIYTVSTHEYRTAHGAGRPPAAWNELAALTSTLATHAEEHMLRLERARQGRAENERLTRSREPQGARAPSLFERLFGRR